MREKSVHQGCSSLADPRVTVHTSRFMVPGSEARTTLAGVLSILLDGDQEINNEDCLFVVPTRRESRAGGREGSSRRCAGNAWNLRRSSPWCWSPLAGFESPSLTPWSPDRIVLFPLPLDRLAELDQEDAPV